MVRQPQPQPQRQGLAPLSSAAGLTLVELMVVVAIISVVAVGVTMAMNRNSGLGSVRTVTQRVWISLRQARNTAASTGAAVRITLDDDQILIDRSSVAGVVPPSGSAVWIRLTTEPAAGTARIYAVTTSAAKNSATPSATTLPVTILFYPDGTVQNTAGTRPGGATIYVQDDTNQYRQRVLLYGLTGYARLMDRW